MYNKIAALKETITLNKSFQSSQVYIVGSRNYSTCQSNRTFHETTFEVADENDIVLKLQGKLAFSIKMKIFHQNQKEVTINKVDFSDNLPKIIFEIAANARTEDQLTQLFDQLIAKASYRLDTGAVVGETDVMASNSGNVYGTALIITVNGLARNEIEKITNRPYINLADARTLKSLNAKIAQATTMPFVRVSTITVDDQSEPRIGLSGVQYQAEIYQKENLDDLIEKISEKITFAVKMKVYQALQSTPEIGLVNIDDKYLNVLYRRILHVAQNDSDVNKIIDYLCNNSSGKITRGVVGETDVMASNSGNLYGNILGITIPTLIETEMQKIIK